MIAGDLVDLFADTYYFLALLSRESHDYQRAVEATAQRRGRLITRAWILLEVANSLASARTRGAFSALMAMLRDDPSVSILPPDAATFEEGIQLYQARTDKSWSWSLTDCLSFIVMKRENLTDALTADHHFTQAGFNAVLA